MLGKPDSFLTRVDSCSQIAQLRYMPTLPSTYVFAFLSTLLLLGGCSSRAARDAPARTVAKVSSTQVAAANAILFRALALVGTPYRYGGNTPEGGFDCSGLVGYVFNDAAGISLPRSSRSIAALPSKAIKRDQLRSGDLVLFASGKQISHVGIYVGENRFVHAPNSGGTVRLDRLDARGWNNTFSHGQRLIN